MAGVCEKGHLGVSFYVGRCVLRESVARGGGLGGHWQWASRIEGLRRGCVDYLSRQFVPKWDSPNIESELATSFTATFTAKVNSKGKSRRP